MKCKTLGNLLVVALILSSSVVGCKKKDQGLTPLPGHGPGAVKGQGPSGPIEPPAPRIPPIDNPGNATSLPIPPGGGAQSNAPRDTWTKNREKFHDQIVYFEFDKSTIKSSEASKLEAVASAMKSLPGKALLIEGHCDERGTEEYNRSLGERRALAAREALVRLGVDASLIETISHGEDKPAETGHDEAAWSKNRRDEFILLTPP